MRRIRSLVMLVGALSSWACSSLEVGRVGPGSPAKGIPYQLTTSMFVVKVDPPTGSGLKPTYTLNQVVVPDPDQRFWVNASPAFLMKTSLKLNFGQRGELASTVTTVEEQIVPTIKALGEFAITALGTAAKVAAMDPSEDMANIIKRVEATTKIIRPPQESSVEPTTAEVSQRGSMVERMREYKFQSPQNLLTRFYPRTMVETGWLLSVSKEIDKDLKIEDSGYTNARNACMANPGCKEFLGPRSKAIGKMIKESTPESLDRLSEELKRLPEGKPEDQQERKTAQGLMAAVLVQAKNQQDIWLSLRGYKETIDTFASMSGNEWRHRRALELEEKIQREERALILSGTTIEPQGLIDLRKQLAFCIGATVEAEREAALRALLVQLGSASSQILGQTQREVSIMKEYQRARQELESVLAILKVKRDALKPEKTSSQLVSREVTPAVIWWQETERSDSDSVRTRLLTNGPNPLPDFVVVIERGMTP